MMIKINDNNNDYDYDDNDLVFAILQLIDYCCDRHDFNSGCTLSRYDDSDDDYNDDDVGDDEDYDVCDDDSW